MNKKNRALSLLLVFAMALLLIPSFGITASAAYTFSGGIVIIDEALVAAEGNEFIIEGDVFSVTVIGDVDVSIIFNSVTIDRSNDKTDTNISGIYPAGQRLNWTRTNDSFYVPTCPLLITGGASVTARFDGNCTFKAGSNGWYATNNNNLQRDRRNYYCGYAGIQVDSGASLTISSAQNLSAYGAYQMASIDTNYVNAVKNSQTVKDSSGNVITVGDGVFDIDDIIAYNSKPFKSNTYTTGRDGYGAPQYAETGGAGSGGAGIGGGTAYNTTASNQLNYTAGTPGTIIINTGTITAVGGHNAAGIGGALNGAATSSKIEINGGNITAVAGRFAAAIGDGDSTSSGTSYKFDVSNDNSYEIIINGGVINAYGGLSASAIGTTDEITISNKGNMEDSALSITITGGTITAQSGESYDGGTTSTAAIGAGNGTNMPDNQITIYSAAKIVASSFSNYAISNYGTDATGAKIPSVNIDPEGYVYLVRFNSIADERTFKIYAIHKNANGHFMYVPTVASDMADGTVNNAINSYYYAYDPGHVSSDGKNIGGFYLVNSDGANVVPADYATNPNNYKFDKDSNRYYPTMIPSLSAYYDVGTVIETITVPGQYKAVAITLPHPEVYGGSYVLEAPLSNKADDKMYALLEKDLPGVTSGMLSSGTSVSDTHFTAGDNPPSESNIKPNIIVDGTAKPFTNLSVGVYNKEGVAQPSLITSFVETVYGYTIYVPNETEKFWLDFSFDTQYINEDKQNVTAKLSLLTVNGVNMLPNNVEDGSVKLTNLEFGKDDRVDIWIKKTDTAAGSTKTISYKITLIIKDKYSFLLNLEALDKVYDGIPVDPNVTAMLEGVGYSTDIERGSLTTTYQELDLGPDEQTDKIAVSNYDVDYTIQSIALDTSNGTLTYTVKFSYRSYTQTYTFTVDKNGSVTLNGGTVILGDFGNNYRIQISNNNGLIRLQLQQYQWWSWNTSGNPVDLSVSADVSYQSASSSHDLSDIEDQLKELITANETTSESTTIYGYTESGTATYNLTLGSVTDSYEVAYSSSGKATVTVSYNEGENQTSKLTQGDKDSIIYTFYEDSDGDGTYETLLGLDAPKNAGRYVVHAFLESQKYEAEGQALFVIYKKEIHIVAIANWLKYVTRSELVSYDGVIAEPGDIYFEGVISGETVALQAGASFGYVDTGNRGYADDVNYNDQKIKITNTVLNSASQVNYTLTGVVDGVCYVPGQIAYSSSGTLFRKEGSNTSLWRKFYPVEETDYLTWITSDGAFTDSRVDYHSPVPNGANAENDYSGGTVGIHREYVKLRTTGDTSARYSVDIEFGAMQYQYTKRVWNVNTGEYEAVEGESKWNGHNGTNNAVTVTNRSNSKIYYQLEFNIDFMYAAISAGADSGIRAALFDTNGARVAGTQVGEKITSTSGKSAVQALLSAAPPDPTGVGTAHSKTYLLVLSGVPSSITEGNTLTYTNVGSVTVEIIELTP